MITYESNRKKLIGLLGKEVILVDEKKMASEDVNVYEGRLDLDGFNGDIYFVSDSPGKKTTMLRENELKITSIRGENYISVK